MTYALEITHTQLETTFSTIKTFGFWQPKSLIAPGAFVPIIRCSSSPLLTPFELSLLRYGLVPPGFTSAREADRYGLHQVRAKRVGWQREVGKLLNAGNRCLVPITTAGETRGVAGLRGRWTRVRHGSEMRVESFAVLTVQDKTDRWVPLEVEAWDWHAWLEGKLNLEMLIGMPPALQP